MKYVKFKTLLSLEEASMRIMKDRDKDKNATQTKTDKWLSPGSKQAIEMGCLCPVLDNSHGKGYMGMKDIFVYNRDCPIHCANEKT